MIRCRSCNTENDERFKYCEKCGTPLQYRGLIRLSTIKCPNCGYSNEPNSKFCQECATQLGASEQTQSKVVPEITIESSHSVPNLGITIEFSYSSSQTFDLALEAAKKFSTFQQIGDGKKASYRVTFAPNEIEMATDLLEYLKGWRRRAVYVDGQKTVWDAVFIFDWCYARKKASFKPEFYCFGYEQDYLLNIWGCIHSQLSFTEMAQWFCFGRWIGNDGTWEFDKERIRHELQNNLYKYRFCPAINLTLVEDALKAIPDRVNPKKDRNWKFVEDWGSTSGGISVRINSSGFNQDVVMKGVSPSGFGALKDVAQKLRLRLSDKV